MSRPGPWPRLRRGLWALLVVLLPGGLVWPVPGVSWLPRPTLALAGSPDDADDADDPNDADDADDHEESGSRRSGGPPTNRPAPASPAALARGLRLSSIWVERRGATLVAVRVGVEGAGTLVATLTLNPSTLEPVGYTQRGLAQPRAMPTPAALSAALTRLSRLSPERITVGHFAVASAGGPLLPLYWGGRPVAYLKLNRLGQPQPDTAGAWALHTSTLKVER